MKNKKSKTHIDSDILFNLINDHTTFHLLVAAPPFKHGRQILRHLNLVSPSTTLAIRRFTLGGIR